MKEWKVVGGQVVLGDTSTQLAAVQAERDAAQAKLAEIQAAHNTLLQQVAALEAAISAAGQAITSAEP